jgi:lysophospholipase L1-like esterase
VPKRAEQRRRRNTTTKAGEPTKVTSVPIAAPIAAMPPADLDWHPTAIDMYKSLADSGQSQFYEPSDWQFARFVCELMSRCLRSDKINGQLVTGIMAGFTDLLATEGSRRRSRVELQRGPIEVPPSVALMEEYRQAAKAP